MALFEALRISKLEAEGNVPGLIKALDSRLTLTDRMSRIPDDAESALVRLGAIAVDPLAAALPDLGSKGRRHAVDALQALRWQPDGSESAAIFCVTLRQWDECVKIGAPAAEPLVGALRDSRLRTESGITRALVAIGASAVGPLTGALADEDRSVRVAAVQALGEIGDASAAEPLIGALADEDRSVRVAAAQALGEIGDASAVGPLIGALADESEYVREAVRSALTAIGTSAVAPLTGKLADEDEYLRGAAVGALWAIGDVRAVDPRLAALRDEVEPLLAAFSDGETRPREQLESVLERSAHDMDADLLRRASMQANIMIKPYVLERCTYEGMPEKIVGADCSRIRQLARQELIRRGLKA